MGEPRDGQQGLGGIGVKFGLELGFGDDCGALVDRTCGGGDRPVGGG